MTDETMLTGMGEWSDGTPVLPLIWHRNAINDVTGFSDCVNGTHVHRSKEGGE